VDNHLVHAIFYRGDTHHVRKYERDGFLPTHISYGVVSLLLFRILFGT
jgi:hypothetical protein